MKPPPFSYHDPRTIADAVSLLGGLDNARALAGGQSLMPMLNMRFVQPDHIIDLNRVEGLSYIRLSGSVIEIGAMTRQRDIEFSNVIRRRCPLMFDAIRHVGIARRAIAAPSAARSVTLILQPNSFQSRLHSMRP